MRITDTAAGPTPRPTRAVVLTADKFEDLELLVPWFRLLEAGASVTIAAPTLDEISGEHGYRVVPDAVIGDIDPADFDLLVIPGGFPDGAPATVRDDVHAQGVARSFMTQNKPVASICHGPWLLASSDQVRDRHVTSYWEDGVPSDLEKAGGHWENTPVVIDDNLVTSRWPPDLPAFCAAMMALITPGARTSDGEEASWPSIG